MHKTCRRVTDAMRWGEAVKRRCGWGNRAQNRLARDATDAGQQLRPRDTGGPRDGVEETGRTRGRRRNRGPVGAGPSPLASQPPHTRAQQDTVSPTRIQGCGVRGLCAATRFRCCHTLLFSKLGCSRFTLSHQNAVLFLVEEVKLLQLEWKKSTNHYWDALTTTIVSVCCAQSLLHIFLKWCRP